MKCPRCDSQHIVKNGHTHNGKQSFKCRDCVRKFVIVPRHQPISESTRKLIDKLLLEKYLWLEFVGRRGFHKGGYNTMLTKSLEPLIDK